MIDTVRTTGLFSALSMLKKHTHHKNYHTDEDAFKFIMEFGKNDVELEKYEYDAIIDTISHVAHCIFSTPEGRLDPSKVLFRYVVEDGNVIWRIKLGGVPYAKVVFNTISGLADGTYGSHLPFSDANPSPIRFNPASDIFRTDIILKEDARAMHDFIVGSLYDSPDYNDIAITLSKCAGANLSFVIPSQPIITMKFRGDIGGSGAYTVKLVSTPATLLLTNNWRKEEFYEAVKEVREWCADNASNLYKLSLKPQS